MSLLQALLAVWLVGIPAALLVLGAVAPRYVQLRLRARRRRAAVHALVPAAPADSRRRTQRTA